MYTYTYSYIHIERERFRLPAKRDRGTGRRWRSKRAGGTAESPPSLSTRIQGGLKVQGSGFRVQGSGFRVQGTFGSPPSLPMRGQLMLRLRALSGPFSVHQKPFEDFVREAPRSGPLFVSLNTC